MLPDTPQTVIPSGQLDAGRATAWASGPPASMQAFVVEDHGQPGEPMVFGQDPDALTTLLLKLSCWQKRSPSEVFWKVDSLGSPRTMRDQPGMGMWVHTLPGFRDRGLATAAAARVCEELLAEGITPVWSCGQPNHASLRVARKLGFREVSRRLYLIRR